MTKNTDCYVPTAGGRVDVIVGDTLRKCQLKTVQADGRLPLRKCGCNSKSNVKIHRYSAADVDFMVAVVPTTFDVYVVPSTIFDTYRNSVKLVVLERMGLKNNISVLKALEQ